VFRAATFTERSRDAPWAPTPRTTLMPARNACARGGGRGLLLRGRNSSRKIGRPELTVFPATERVSRQQFLPSAPTGRKDFRGVSGSGTSAEKPPGFFYALPIYLISRVWADVRHLVCGHAAGPEFQPCLAVPNVDMISPDTAFVCGYSSRSA